VGDRCAVAGRSPRLGGRSMQTAFPQTRNEALLSGLRPSIASSRVTLAALCFASSRLKDLHRFPALLDLSTLVTVHSDRNGLSVTNAGTA